MTSVGASGAVFGLFGAVLVVSKRLGGDVRGILVLIGINLALGFVMANIAWQAHVGGLVTGALLTAAYAYAPAARRRLVAFVAPLTLGAAAPGGHAADVRVGRRLRLTAGRPGEQILRPAPLSPRLLTPVELHPCSYPQTCAPLGTEVTSSQVRMRTCG